MTLRSKILVIVLIFLLLVLFSVFLYRNSLLELGVQKIEEKLLDRYRVALTIDDYGFDGVRDVYFRKIVLAPLTGDTLLTIKNVELKISIGLLLRLKLGFKEIYADSVFVNAVKRDAVSNYSFLSNKTIVKDTVRTTVPIGYYESFAPFLEKVNRFFGSIIYVKDFTFRSQVNEKSETIKIPQLAFNGKEFRCDVVTTSLTEVASYSIEGIVNTADSYYKFNILKLNNLPASLPLFDMIDSMKVEFDAAQVSLKANDENEKMPLQLSFNIQNLILNHWRISNTDVIVPEFSCNLNTTIEHSLISVNDSSVFKLGKLPITVSGSYQREPEPNIKLDIAFNTTSEIFFGSLPQGMFNSLKGLQATGNLNYNLHFNVNTSNPDQLVFDSKLEKENFRILKFGEENFSRINEPFIYTAMDRDKEMRDILVGEANPMFTPLGNVSDYLKNTVLTSEDPSFFQHGGFVQDAFRESIAENIKQGRFARGGSTISMQLVKNIFLSRNKTVSRKLEEALIVWLIEKNHLVSKERMFEIYLNIIEWGPDIYGVGEASRFYFGKQPMDLSLSESIFLSEIIPRPKYFKYAFDSSGHLKPYHKGYFDLIGKRLLIRGKISQNELDSLKPDVVLKGSALKMILPSDTIPVDSTDFEEIRIFE